MNPLALSISDERMQHFVGRQAHCQWIESWLNNPPAPTQIVAVTGIGGVGKSTLLLRLIQIAASHQVVGAWMDGRTCLRSPRGFLDALPESFLDWQRSPEPRPRLVLAIDNYDELQVLEAWFKEVFMASLPDTGVVVFFASRSNLMESWLLDPGWQNRVKLWRLGDLSPQEVEDFLARREWPTEDIHVARRLALGHPLSLALVAEARRRWGQPDPESLNNLVRESISARLLREVTDPSLQPLVDVLTLMATANADLMQRVLERRITARQYQQLKTMSFVKTTAGGGVGLHDIAVMHLFDDFRQRDPNAFQTLRQRAVNVLLSEWDCVDMAHRGALAHELLWLCRDVFQDITQYADLSYAADLEVTGYQSSDRPLLHQFVAQWSRQILPIADTLALFDRIIRQFPESIRVTRRAGGTPVGVFVTLPLYDKTLDLIQEFHPRLVHGLLTSDLGIRHCAREEANARYNVLTGIDFQQTHYNAQQILGVIARDQFALQVGILGLLLLTNPGLKHFLSAIGYQSRPFPVSDPPVPDEELFVMDLRDQHYGQWIRNILAHRSAPQPPLTASDVRYFLSEWEHPPVLASARLTTRFDRPPEAVKRLILEALEPHASAPMTDRDQAALRVAFLSGTTTAWRQADMLHVSRATLYRHVGKALDHLAAWLEQKLRQV